MVTENSGWNEVEPQNAETTCVHMRPRLSLNSCVFIFSFLESFRLIERI